MTQDFLCSHELILSDCMLRWHHHLTQFLFAFLIIIIDVWKIIIFFPKSMDNHEAWSHCKQWKKLTLIVIVQPSHKEHWRIMLCIPKHKICWVNFLSTFAVLDDAAISNNSTFLVLWFGIRHVLEEKKFFFLIMSDRRVLEIQQIVSSGSRYSKTKNKTKNFQEHCKHL